VSERRAEIDGPSVFWHEHGGTPVIYVHGVPTDGDDWLPFLERTGGVAPDLPGFGRSAKPAHFPYSIEGYGRWLESFADHLGLERFSLVVHDWGAAALELAQRRPERIDKLVVINAVPLLPGYRWHRVARAWRIPVVGEMAMGFTTKWGLRRSLRGAAPALAQPEKLDPLWERFDHGTQRAILKLYRSAPAHELARAGERLGQIGRPALVVWGKDDPYLPASFAEGYARALDGRLLALEQTGHWPWLDRPEVVDEVAAFLRGE
jgi:pimeloyl-ACP methyl ester carboxylesterase